jgi:hypothetical protein
MGAPYVWVILKFCRRIADPSLVQLRDFRSASISGGEMTLWVIFDRMHPSLSSPL